MKSKPTRSNPLTIVGGAGCGIVFLLPFAAAGLFMAGLTAWSLWDYGRMQSWVETTATLRRVEARNGDHTTSIEAAYQYEYAGNRYHGDRVAIHSGGDNIGHFQEQLLGTLRSAHEAQRRNRSRHVIPGGQAHVFGQSPFVWWRSSAEKWTSPRPVNGYPSGQSHAS